MDLIFIQVSGFNGEEYLFTLDNHKFKTKYFIISYLLYVYI
jgi:hypothetical protein